MNIRPASRDDARELAYLINLAGEGLPEYLWSSLCEDGETAPVVTFPGCLHGGLWLLMVKTLS